MIKEHSQTNYIILQCKQYKNKWFGQMIYSGRVLNNLSIINGLGYVHRARMHVMPGLLIILMILSCSSLHKVFNFTSHQKQGYDYNSLDNLLHAQYKRQNISWFIYNDFLPIIFLVVAQSGLSLNLLISSNRKSKYMMWIDNMTGFNRNYGVKYNKRRVCSTPCHKHVLTTNLFSDYFIWYQNKFIL